MAYSSSIADENAIMRVTKEWPYEFASVGSPFVSSLVGSGAFFARKFCPDAMVEDLQIPVRTYILQHVLGLRYFSVLDCAWCLAWLPLLGKARTMSRNLEPFEILG